MNGLSIRPMRNRDFARFAKRLVPDFVGYIAEMDGEEIGAGAIVWQSGRPFLCFDPKEALLKMPVRLHRFAKKFIAAAIKANGELYTVETANEPRAGKWLRCLGFCPTDEILNGQKVWKWQL